MSEELEEIPYYECPYCYKKLTTQTRLEGHTCEPKRRAEYLSTPNGRGAFYAYEMWLNLQGYQVKSIDSFIESKYYKAFERFVKFCNNVAIPDREDYIRYMIKNSILPFRWNNIDVYDEYLQYFDTNTTPSKLVNISLGTLYELSDLFECEIKDVLSNMYASDLMKLVVARKLSPWLLLVSRSFMLYMKNEVTDEQKLLINSTIPSDMWIEKFGKNIELVKEFKELAKKIGF